MNVGDIVERSAGDGSPAPPPAAPKAKPLPKKWRPSRPKKVVLDPAQAPPPVPTTSQNQDHDQDQGPLTDEERMHLENVKRIAAMSPDEIEKERQELYDQLDPAVLQSLLRRVERKESASQPKAKEPHLAPMPQSIPEPKVPEVEAVPEPAVLEPTVPETTDPEPAHADGDVHASLHFPPPPEELKKYFPDLPVESEKLAWMQPVSAEEEAEYSSQMQSLAPSELRFDFHGNLITPRYSRLIDPTAGLHHHGDAPSAAGYTLPELSHLARSAHPAQRSIAIQTAGRVLHKLYKGRFNKSSDLQAGLEQLVTATRIMDTLYEAAGEKTRSLTVRSLATEALWLIETVRPPKKNESV